MAAVRSRLRALCDRAVKASVTRVITRLAEQVSTRTIESLDTQIVEIRRILRDQGDAADEVAEVVGRLLTTLSDEVATLTRELVLLREDLDSRQTSR